MNSAQRRKANKLYRHTVKVSPKDGDRYYTHDQRVDNMHTWCRKNLRKNTWQGKSYWDHAEFKFTNEKDAIYFALKCL